MLHHQQQLGAVAQQQGCLLRCTCLIHWDDTRCLWKTVSEAKQKCKVEEEKESIANQSWGLKAQQQDCLLRCTCLKWCFLPCDAYKLYIGQHEIKQDSDSTYMYTYINAKSYTDLSTWHKKIHAGNADMKQSTDTSPTVCYPHAVEIREKFCIAKSFGGQGPNSETARCDAPTWLHSASKTTFSTLTATSFLNPKMLHHQPGLGACSPTAS